MMPLLENELTNSQKCVLGIVNKNAGLTPREITKLSGFATRTVRYAVRKLLRLNLICSVVNLEDTRQNKFYPV